MRRFWKLSAAAAAVTLSLALGGCTQTTGSSVAGVNRSQMMLVSSSELDAEADKQYSEIIAKAKQQGVLNTDKQLTRRVQNIANRLIAQAPNLRPDCRDWDWQVNVITEDTLNAWCMPGGKIVVYSGIVKQLDLTDDEIAVILGHEICHALREHSREQMSQQLVTEGLFSVAELFGVDRTYTGLGRQAAQIGVTLPFSRSHETEADELGLELAYRAGFDPEAAPTLWKKMMAASQGSEPLEILSTHPSDEKRIANLQTLAKNLKASNLQPVKD